MPNLGLSVNVTPNVDVPAGRPYPLGNVVGIVDRPIRAGTIGAVDLTPARVVPIAKPTGPGTDYGAFATAYLWPVSIDGQVVTGATGVKVGIVSRAASSTDSTVDVLVFPGCGL